MEQEMKNHYLYINKNERSLDLMIGDWVIFHDSGYASDGTTWEENRVCQIDSIDEDVRVKWYDESGCKEDCPHVSTVLLSTIPITPEILEKNGFELKSDGWLWCEHKGIEDKNYIFIQFSKGCEEVRLCEMNFTNKVLAKFNNINYVHELQHALKLCGIAKEIEL